MNFQGTIPNSFQVIVLDYDPFIQSSEIDVSLVVKSLSFRSSQAIQETDNTDAYW